MREKYGLSRDRSIDLSALLAATLIAFCMYKYFILMSYQTFRVEELDQGTIVRVTLNRLKVRNAISWTCMRQFGGLFKSLNTHPNVRVVIMNGEGPMFTSGLDLNEAGELFGATSESQDPARNAIVLADKIRQFQSYFLAIHQCRVPVIMGAHKLCLGAGVDLFSAADIRFCTKDCKFAIRQIDLGLATDIGTLQFFPKYTGSSSTFKELALTGRMMEAQEAKRIGFVSRLLSNKEQLDKALLQTARTIASKSPVGIYTIKNTLNKGEKDLYEGFDYIKTANSVMLQSKDLMEAFTAYLQKRKPLFPKL